MHLTKKTFIITKFLKKKSFLWDYLKNLPQVIKIELGDTIISFM